MAIQIDPPEDRRGGIEILHRIYERSHPCRRAAPPRMKSISPSKGVQGDVLCGGHGAGNPKDTPLYPA